MRFVLSALDLADLSGQDSPTPPNGYAFPRLANHYYNATAVINEQEVIYNCELRNSGSPWTRGGDLSRGLDGAGLGLGNLLDDPDCGTDPR